MLKIYGTPLSSPTNKVRYVANYLNVPYEFQLINLAAGEQKKPEFLKINAYGKTPAMDDNGFTLSESNAIIRYLAAKQKSDLYPTDLQQRARVDQWMDYAAQHVGMALSKIMYNTYFYKMAKAERDERSLQDGKTFLAMYLPIVENQLTQHAFVAGDTLTLADFVLLSALDTCELVQVDLTPFTHIVSWRKKLMGETFYTKCHTSYTDAFKKVVGEAAAASS